MRSVNENPLASSSRDVVAAEADLMWLQSLPSWARRLATIGVLPDDSDDDRLRKTSLTLMIGAIVILAVGWVVAYASMGLYLSAAIPLAYQVLAIVSLGYLSRTGRFDRFRAFHLAVMLALPVLLQWSLGGFRASSGVVLWSLVSPLSALVFSPRPLPWLGAYLVLVLLSGILEPVLDPASIPVVVNISFFALNIGAVSGVVYFTLRYFMRGLELERKKSERLLLNVLPQSIARRLKLGEQPIADRFENTAVLFADLVDFTPLSEQLPPEKIVAMLNEIFSDFDGVAERHGLEKIKTIGDAYLAVAGLPEPRQDATEAIAEAALEMQEAVTKRSSALGLPLRLRIGIDVGPVVAGVIGKRKFAYDLWGDTVNIAARMESHGLPGQIQVTSRVYRALEHEYRFRPRGPVQVKGKGEIDAYLLVGRAN